MLLSLLPLLLMFWSQLLCLLRMPMLLLLLLLLMVGMFQEGIPQLRNVTNVSMVFYCVVSTFAISAAIIDVRWWCLHLHWWLLSCSMHDIIFCVRLILVLVIIVVLMLLHRLVLLMLLMMLSLSVLLLLMMLSIAPYGW